MITFELYKRNWNTAYLKYDPEKWAVSIHPHGDHITIEAMTFDAATKKSYGPFNAASIRNSPIPEYVREMDILVWN